MRTNKIQVIGAAAALAAVMALPAGAFADNHEDEAMVRVGHFSPDAPAVDIYANGAILAGLEGVEFGTLSDYIEVPADTYALAVVVAGEDPADATVIAADVPFEAGSKTTVAATGFVADIAPVVLNDDFVNEEGKAQVRVVHFSPDAPAVDIAPDGAEALIPGLAFPDFAGYVALPEGEYDLEVRLAGEDTVALQLDPLTLPGNAAATVFAIGSASGDESLPALQALVAIDGTADMDDMDEDMDDAEEMTEE